MIWRRFLCLVGNFVYVGTILLKKKKKKMLVLSDVIYLRSKRLNAYQRTRKQLKRKTNYIYAIPKADKTIIF